MLESEVCKMKVHRPKLGEWKEIVVTEFLNPLTGAVAYRVSIACAHGHYLSRPAAVKAAAALCSSYRSRRLFVALYREELANGHHGHLSRKAARLMIVGMEDRLKLVDLMFEICGPEDVDCAGDPYEGIDAQGVGVFL